MADLSEQVVGLLEALRAAGSSCAIEVIADWGGRVLGDLSPASRSWLTVRFAQLGQEERTAVIQGLAPVQQQSELGEGVGELYRAFMGDIPNDGRNTDEIRNHVAEVARNVLQVTPTQAQAATVGTASAINSARSYLSEVMPVLASSLDLLLPEDTAALIDRVFSEAAYIGSDPALRGEIHSSMIGKWPNPDDVQYQALSIFERAETALQEQPGLAEAPVLLRSLTSLTGGAHLDTEYTG